MLIVISGPSGSGKTTIVQDMLNRFPEIKFSVSATTRNQRPKEHEGVHYYFLTKNDFQKKINRGELVEWEEIFGNYYGTLKSVVEDALQKNTHLLFDIDVKGALSIKKKYPHQSVLIFIMPPDVDTLHKRLNHRATDSSEIIERRLKRAEMEMKESNHFDHLVVNDEITIAIDTVAAIIHKSISEGNFTDQNSENN